MYLINLPTMKLEYFQDDRNLVYAILSHRWREEEVLFEHMQNGSAQNKAGYAKLKRFCEQAAADRYSYAWCDTCCIDKSSSAELSESINSMFRWYQNAAVCYAYLFDVKASKIDDSSDFKDSAWFTRGWCLQELLAPQSLTFFNHEWTKIGTKKELSDDISKITKIPNSALRDQRLASFSIAQRMSWASDRVTTRTEDMAYSLLGIFGVNMPLLYGEGERAFLRLQEEIMRKSRDQSIFVHSTESNRYGLLAAAPADFRNSSDIESSGMIIGEPYSFTNMGLSIELLLFPWPLEVYLAQLDCKKKGSGSPISIFLMLQPQVVQHDGTKATDHAVRIKFDGNGWINDANVEKLPALQKRLYLDYEAIDQTQIERKRYGFWIRTFEGINLWAKEWRMWAVSWNEWNDEKRILEIPAGEYGTAGLVMLRTRRVSIRLRLGFTVDFEPVIEFDVPNFHYNGLVPKQTVNVRGPDDFQFVGSNGETLDASLRASVKSKVLSEMSWAEGELRERKQMGVLVKAEHRDHEIKFGPRGFGQGTYMFAFHKALVEGVRIWVVDINWKWGKDDLPANLNPPPQSMCDGCGWVRLSHGLRSNT